MSEEFNTYRDGQVHVMAEKCKTCIFRPHERFVPGSRVAEMVRKTQEAPGGNVVCHATLGEGVDNAICRGHWDAFKDKDEVMRLAQAYGIVVEDEVPT